MKQGLKHLGRLWLLGAVVLAAAGLCACMQRAKPGTVRAAYCEPQSAEKLCAARTEAARPLVESISIGGTALVQDCEDGTFYFSLPQGENTAEQTLVCAGEPGVKLAIQHDFEGQELPGGSTLALFAYTQAEYQKLTLVCTTLPIMKIDAEKDAEKIDKETSTPFVMTLYDNRPSVGLSVVQAEGTMHVRGRGSSNYPKKGYRLTLRHSNGEENDVALLGLRTDGDWILYADYAETDKVRQVYTAKLWQEGCGADNEFGVQNSNEYKFLELFLNGRYWGLYALGYPIDSKQWQLSEGEYSYFKNNPMVYETDPDYTIPGEVPGYELAGGGTQGEEINDIWQPLNDYYYTLLYTDWENRDVLYDLADANNAIDSWLFTDLIQGADQMLDDNRLYNYYLTSKKTKEGRKILFTPWDFDRTWGYVLGENNSNNFELTPKDHVTMTLNPVNRLIEWEETRMIKAVQQHWKLLRKNAWSDENVQRLLDGYEADVFASGVYERDHARWPDGGYTPGQNDLRDFRAYIKDRFAEMDRYVAALGSKEAA